MFRLIRCCLPLSRVSLVWAILCCAYLFPGGNAAAQIRLAPSPESRAAPHPATPHPDALIPTTVGIYLCVDNSTAYPCPVPINSDTTYIAAITYTYGQALDGLITVQSGAGGGSPTGSISLTANGTSFCTLQAGVRANCPPLSTVFDPGVYLIEATYSGDDTYAPSTSLPVTVTVLQNTLTGLTLTTSRSPSPFGSPVTFTAMTTAGFGAIPKGTVTFSDGTNPLAAVVLDNVGEAQFTISTLALGMHTIKASYPGTLDFRAAPDAEIPQVITPPGTATTVASSLNPSVLGDDVVFTATVTASAGVQPGGAVNFNDGTKTFATTLVSSTGTAQAPPISTLTAGTHSITANYSGDANTAASVSPVLVQQVNYPLTMAPPGFTVTVTPSPVVLGVGLTAHLTVTVAAKGGFDEAVTLTCGNLPKESACTFGEATIPAGGGTTTLDLSTMAPHDCGTSAPYFLGTNRPPTGLTGGTALGGGVPLLAGLLVLLLPTTRLRRRLRGGLVALCAAFCLLGMSGCSSHCTDFGTYPGHYTFDVVGTGGADVVPVTTTLPPAGTIVVKTAVALSVKL